MDMFVEIKKTCNGLLFLATISCLIGKEMAIYMWTRDFGQCIDRLTVSLSSVNILYVKIFQAIALNNHFIDETINNKLLQFTDNAPWTYKDVNLVTLVNLADKYKFKLKYGYEIPINSGMISLVFKVYDQYDNPFVVKMKRNNIQQRLQSAIDNLLFLTRILSFIPVFHKYQLANVIHKNIDIIRHQTNFLEEVDNLLRIRYNCRNVKYVKIPAVMKDITQEYPDCIVMEFIEGMKISQIQPPDYEGFAKQVMKFGFVTSIVHGVTHGDLHGGNILFIKDKMDTKYPYKIGVIDFGIIYELDPQYKGVLFDVLTQMFDADPKVSAIKILNAGLLDPPDVLQRLPREDYDHIIGFTADIIRETITNAKKANQVQIYKFLSQLKEYLGRSDLSDMGIKPSDNFVKTQLVLAMAQGVTLTLCNDDFIGLADKVINELFHTDMMMD